MITITNNFLPSKLSAPQIFPTAAYHMRLSVKNKSMSIKAIKITYNSVIYSKEWENFIEHYTSI